MIPPNLKANLPEMYVISVMVLAGYSFSFFSVSLLLEPFLFTPQVELLGWVYLASLPLGKVFLHQLFFSHLFHFCNQAPVFATVLR